jgi:HD-like signal output (HDOD) protein
VLLTALERSALIIDHAELGGELMRRWNLPPDVVAAVRYHHELEAVPRYEQLTAAVQVGDMIAHQLFAEDLAGTDLLAPSTAAFGALQFSPEDLVRLVDKARAEMEKVNGMFEL